VFQQLRDRPQSSAETWLGRRILRHYGLLPAIRRRIRNELMEATPRNQRDDWQIAILVLNRVRALQGGFDPEDRQPELVALRETESVSAREWYRDVILNSPLRLPHLLVRARNDQASVIWTCFSNRLLANVRTPYSVEDGKTPETVVILQPLPAYLGAPVERQLLLNNLFGGSREGIPDAAELPADDEDEDPDYG